MIAKYRQEIDSFFSQVGLPLPTKWQFDQIGEGAISTIFRVKLDNGSTVVIKLSEKDTACVRSELHNRELEFYQWLQGVTKDQNASLKLPLFHGGKACEDTVGFILLEDFSSRISSDADYLKGFRVEWAINIVRQLAAVQSVYLSSEGELKNNIHRIDFSSPVHNCLVNIDSIEGINDEMRSKLREWVEPVTLFKIHTDVPKEVEGISPTLIHCDLWPGNLLFHKEGANVDLLTILDWQCFKIGNPLLDVASVLGESMTVEDRRAHTETILKAYVDEVNSSQSKFNRQFDMTIEKARVLLRHAQKWACVQLMFAVVTTTEEERAENPLESGVCTERLRELLADTLKE